MPHRAQPAWEALGDRGLDAAGVGSIPEAVPPVAMCNTSVGRATRPATTAAVDTALSSLYVVIRLLCGTVWRLRQAMSRVGWRQDGGKYACRLVS
jgi:hypothetical protein